MSNSWYPRYAGDYARKTAHLSLMEHGAFTLLLDFYYSTGKPIPSNDHQVMRICSAFDASEQDAVMSVLNQFFIKGADGWENKRAAAEVEKRAEISEKRKRAVEIREQNRIKPSSCDTSLDTSHDDTTTTTTTTTIIPTPKKTPPRARALAKPNGRFDEFWNNFPKQRAGSKPKAKIAWDRALAQNSEITPDDLISVCMVYAQSDEVRRGYAKGCAPWLNDERWRNDYQLKPQEKINVRPTSIHQPSLEAQTERRRIIADSVARLEARNAAAMAD